MIEFVYLQKERCNIVWTLFIATISCICIDMMHFQYHVIYPSGTLQPPITDHSLTTPRPLTDHSPSPNPPLNKTTTITDCCVLFLISTQQLFSGYLTYIYNVNDCLLNETMIIAFDFTTIPLETTLSMSRPIRWYL